MQTSGLGISALMLPDVPIFGNPVPAAQLLDPWMDVVAKKKLADIALNAARSNGASYTDVRIGRYLQQYLYTREKQVQNIVNAESYGIGIRVIVNGTWGFSATSNVTPEGVAKCAATAVEIAKANSKFQKEPVVLAEQKGVGEKTWKTPLKKKCL